MRGKQAVSLKVRLAEGFAFTLSSGTYGTRERQTPFLVGR